MPRIPDEQLERLKQAISLPRLVEARGIELKRHGSDLIGLCPFHDDREPSLVISPKQNLWHCLGACQSGGSVIDWVMKSEGVSFRHAVELLQADYQPTLAAAKSSTDASPSSPAVKRTTTVKLDNPLPREAEDGALLNRVIEFYHETLKQHPDAQAYLQKRGIADREAVAEFKLGVANRTLGYRLPAKNRAEGAALRGQLQRIGILRPSGHEHFSGSLIIPVLDEGGHVVEVYGRKLNDHLRKGTPKHLYLPGPHRGVWNIKALKASPELIVCESLIDALTFWCAGFRNVTAAYGVSGFNDEHLAALKTHHTERVLIAYDRDEAGEQAAAALAQRLIEAGIDAYRLHFPHGMDANAYALSAPPASKSLGVVIRSAIWLGQGQAQPVTSEAGTTTTLTAATAATPPAPTPSVTPPTTTLAPGVVIDTETGEVLSDHHDEPDTAAPRSDDDAAAATAQATPAPLAAPVIPALPVNNLDAEINDKEVRIALGERRYRIRGLERNQNFAALKINLLVSATGLDGRAVVHIDTLDLYSAKARHHYSQQAATELGLKETIIKHDLSQLLLQCERLVEQRLSAPPPSAPAATMSDHEQQAALALLRAPDLLERIIADFERCGVVGERANLLTAYLACVSRKLDHPLAILIQSSSAAGKSALMDAVLAMIPPEERVHYSAMTGQSLYYLGETALQHKILAIAEEQGMSEAAYALKILQSQGALSIASTGKDPLTGELKTRQYHLQGPVMIFLTTTAIDIDEELQNRCLVLTVNETRAQTQAIQQQQRRNETLQGLLAEHTRSEVLSVQQNAQRLLKPLSVVNPYAERLSFSAERTRSRRDQRKYLTLIRAMALLHQYQRPIKTVQHQGQALDYIEVALSDIEQANTLAHHILGRTLDELPPQTRRLLTLIHHWVSEQCRAQAITQSDYHFSRRQLREHSHWSDTALKVHLARLVALEYLIVHRHARRFVYALCYQGQGAHGEAFVLGLLETGALKHPGYEGKRSGSERDRSGSGQGPVSPRSGSGQVLENSDNHKPNKALSDSAPDSDENRRAKEKNNTPSYRSGDHETVPGRGEPLQGLAP